MTPAALRALPDPDDEASAGSWPAALRAAVRDEFAVEIYRPTPGDAVLFGPTCAVGGCPATGANRSLGLKATGVNRSVGTRFRGYLCVSHVRMWRTAGSPPIDGWVRQAALTARGQSQPDACIVTGCVRSARSNGFCNAHVARWVKADRPDRAAFAAIGSVVVVREQRCVVPARRFPSCGSDGFCDGHLQRYFNARYRRLGLTVSGYLKLITDARTISAPKFDMRDLPAVVQLELQYALQCRQQAARAAIGPLIFGTVVRWLRDLGVESVLERSETFWVHDSRERFRSSTRANPMAWLRYVRHSALTLRDNHEGLEIWDSTRGRSTAWTSTTATPTSPGGGSTSQRSTRCGCASWSNAGRAGGSRPRPSHRHRSRAAPRRSGASAASPKSTTSRSRRRRRSPGRCLSAT